jgi:hypothetical protein
LYFSAIESIFSRSENRLIEGETMPLFLTEYVNSAKDTGSNFIAAGMEPSVNELALTLTSSSQQATVFNAQTSFVMVHAQEAACLAWGTNPTAVTTKQRMAAGETRYYGIPQGRGFRVAAILGV